VVLFRFRVVSVRMICYFIVFYTFTNTSIP
jgi:hypothetical protein